MNSSITKIKSFFLGDLSMKISSCLILAPHISFSIPFRHVFFYSFPCLFGSSERTGELIPWKPRAGRGRDLLTGLFFWPFPPCNKGCSLPIWKKDRKFCTPWPAESPSHAKSMASNGNKKTPTPKTKQQTQTEKHWTSSLIYYLYSSFAFYTNCIFKNQK